MEFATYLRFVLALIFVLGLIGVAAWAVRRTGLGAGGRVAGGRGRRLKVVEVAAIDGRRRLVLVRRDRTEHLLLLGATTDLVIERGVAASDASNKDET